MTAANADTHDSSIFSAQSSGISGSGGSSASDDAEGSPKILDESPPRKDSPSRRPSLREGGEDEDDRESNDDVTLSMNWLVKWPIVIVFGWL